MNEAIVEIRILVEFGLMSPAEANRVIAGIEDAR